MTARLYTWYVPTERRQFLVSKEIICLLSVNYDNLRKKVESFLIILLYVIKFSAVFFLRMAAYQS